MAESSPSILNINGLSYRYPTGFQALDDVTFSVANEEVVAVVGPSGAGKSTLLMHINGLLPDKLENNTGDSNSPILEIAGLPLSKTKLPEIRRMVGFLFQDPDDQLFCPTVREDVAFGPLNLGLPNDDVLARVRESLEAVGLSDYENRSTLQLSVGERKRVCLAGVLACRPVLLALDEPTSNLDPRARRSLLEVLNVFPGSQIIATHDLDLVVEHCHRVIILDEGKVCAVGQTRTLLANEELMEKHGLEVPLRLQLEQRNGKP